MTKNFHKKIYFIYNFVIRYFFVLPVIIQNIFAIYYADAKWIPHVVLVTASLASLLWLFANEKINKEFLSSPAETLWNRKINVLKQMVVLPFVFDETQITKFEFYMVTSLLSFGTFILTIISVSVSLQNNKPLFPQALFLPGFFLIFFGGIMFIIAYLPAWKLSRKNKSSSKPFWYWFSYNSSYNRQHHSFKNTEPDLFKNSKFITILLLILSSALLIDWVCGSPFLVNTLVHSNKHPVYGSSFLRFIEFILFYITAGNGIKYFYADQLRLDSEKCASTNQNKELS